jgi:hypothetical protein
VTQLIVLVDALGWLTAERLGFMAERLPHRRRIDTVFGYSSTAIPSLLTGAWPEEHGHWFLYRRAGNYRPFSEGRWIARLPGRPGERWRVRCRLQEYWKNKVGIHGYFSLYSIPLDVLAELEPVERADTWAAGAFPRTPSLIDHLVAGGWRHHVSDWRVSDAEKLVRARAAVEQETPEVLVLYLTEIDSVQHRVGTRHVELDRAVRELEQSLGGLVRELEARGPVGVTLFSDHGMTDITGHRDLIGELAAEGLVRGRDYRGFFDSTVARFWDVRDPGRLLAVLRGRSWGRILDEATMANWRVRFPGREYGDLFFVADPGELILPSDMGRAPLAAMHGYDPADPTSDACLLSDREVPLAADHITAVLPALRRRIAEGV